MAAATPTVVYLERGQKRVFAGAFDWPGWCRSGKDDDQALDALREYAARYRVVTKEAHVRFPARAEAELDVVERLKGSGTTDFGAPGAIAKRDSEPLTEAEATRNAKLVTASWAILERVASGAPKSLRKGPRGGGRDRDAIVQHVADAEVAYARKLGIRERDLPADADLREVILKTLRTATDGPALVAKGWPPRYAARRIAWHALDHAWEIEDRSS
jgi:hypothetical protein